MKKLICHCGEVEAEINTPNDLKSFLIAKIEWGPILLKASNPHHVNAFNKCGALSAGIGQNLRNLFIFIKLKGK